MRKSTLCRTALIVMLVFAVSAVSSVTPWILSVTWKHDEAERAFWIFVPIGGLGIDYGSAEVILSMTIRSDSTGFISFGLPVWVENVSREFEVGILQPLAVAQEQCYVDNPERSMASSTTQDPEGGFFTYCQYEFNQTGPHLAAANLAVESPLTSASFGERGMRISFFGGNGFPEIALPLLEQLRAVPATKMPLALSIVYPANWLLNEQETTPRPYRHDGNDYGREGSWLLHFTEGLRSYSMMLDINWTVPPEIATIRMVSLISQLVGQLITVSIALLKGARLGRTERGGRSRRRPDI